MSRPCAAWPYLGWEVCHEDPYHGPPRGGVPGVPARAGLPAEDRRADAPVLRPLCRRVRASRAADDGTGASLGTPAGAADPPVSGAAAGSGTDAGPLPGRTGVRHRGPAARVTRPGPRPRPGLHFLLSRNHRPDPGGPDPHPAPGFATPDVRHAHRLIGLYRAAHPLGPRP